MPITCISFDLDGTLAEKQFDKIIWNTEIPKLYADTHGVDLETAKKEVYSEYYKALYIEYVKNWTDIDMWFKRLALHDWQSLMERMRHHIFVYSDVIPVLEMLSKEYRLVIVSDSEPKFLNMKLDALGLRKYFKEIVSAPAELRVLKKDPSAFRLVMERLGAEPHNILHVGDDIVSDFSVPVASGAKAILIDRSGEKRGENIIHSLRELPEKVEKMSK
jgi:putative hydrolase of the HAD superfamily